VAQLRLVRAYPRMKITLGWCVFIILEMIAVISAFTWELTTSALGRVLWLAQFFLLMPGSILVGRLVERTLWTSELSLRSLGILKLTGSIAVNAVVWFLLLQLVRRFRRGHGP
jgi:hypothetical protein